MRAPKVKTVAQSRLKAVEKIALDALRTYASPPSASQYRKFESIQVVEAGNLTAPQIRRLGVNLDEGRLAREIRDHLQGESVDFVVQVARGGKPGFAFASGFARKSSDGNSRWTIGTRQHVASVSKLFTAALLVKILDEKEIGFDTRIKGYLPEHWTLGQKATFATFRNILSHVQGFWDSHFTYTETKRHLESAMSGIGEGWHYSNTNYALMRVLIPIVNGTVSRKAKWIGLPGLVEGPRANDIVWDATTRSIFERLSREQIWDKAGVPFATLVSNEALRNDPAYVHLQHITNASLAYPLGGSRYLSGHDISTDLTALSGAVGWHLNVTEMLAGASAMRRGKVMRRSLFRQMCEAGLGPWIWNFADGSQMFYHDGSWSDGEGYGQISHLSFLPDNIEVAILCNQPRSNDVRQLPSLGSIVANASLAARV